MLRFAHIKMSKILLQSKSFLSSSDKRESDSLRLLLLLFPSEFKESLPLFPLLWMFRTLCVCVQMFVGSTLPLSLTFPFSSFKNREV